jgi:hypothetical protein
MPASPPAPPFMNRLWVPNRELIVGRRVTLRLIELSTTTDDANSNLPDHCCAGSED